jgi:AraC-like DNA-binding protein
MDALSEILKVVQLEGAVFFHARFTAPWSVVSPASQQLAPVLQPGAEQLFLYHLMAEGHCHVEMDGLPPVRLEAGDLVLFPHGDAHTMASSLPAQPMAPLDPQAVLAQRPRLLQFGGGGDVARFVCGYLACDPRLCRPVLSALPRLLVVKLRDEEQSHWLERTMLFAVEQAAATGLGAQGVLAKLSEALLVEALRRHAAALPEGQTGWLAGLRDPVVGRCLALMHERPAEDWTIERLARESASSRSVLAERFTHYVGTAPMLYLTRWRLALAANLLARSSMNLARIAEEVGYEGDAAFSRAFRREYSLPPAAWRRQFGRRAGLS